MHRIRLALAVLVPCLLAPASAGAASFSDRGTWLLGGDVFLNNNGVDLGFAAVDTLQLELSPQLTYFFSHGVGVRFSPSLRFIEQSIEYSGPFAEEAEDESESQTWLGLSVGPAFYLPIATDTYVALGGQLGYRSGSLEEDLDLSGITFAAEAGLAFAVGTGGVAEFGLRWENRPYEVEVNGDEVPGATYDEDDLFLGFRLGLVL